MDATIAGARPAAAISPSVQIALVPAYQASPVPAPVTAIPMPISAIPAAHSGTAGRRTSQPWANGWSTATVSGFIAATRP
jgi:hypothetical protein